MLYSCLTDNSFPLLSLHGSSHNFTMTILPFLQFNPNSLAFWSNTSTILSTLQTFDDTTSFHYVSIMAELLNTHVVWVTLLTVFDLLAVIPANILTVVVIIRSKDLWTAGNVVLSINGVVQAIGSAINLVLRCTGFTLFPINENNKDELYLVGWWTYCIMMRTGSNWLVNKPTYMINNKINKFINLIIIFEEYKIRNNQIA